MNKVVRERLLAVDHCSDSTGKGFFELLRNVLEENGLDVSSCIDNATDGAANMQGVYNGFSAWLNKESPGQIHVWCYSHILNLVIRDATRSHITRSPAASLLSLMNLIAVFFRENVLSNLFEKNSHRRLQTIGETRWCSKMQPQPKILALSRTHRLQCTLMLCFL